MFPSVKGNYTPSDETQTYVYQLALLLRDGNEFTGGVGLKPNLNIYVEHSNEVGNIRPIILLFGDHALKFLRIFLAQVWNFGFPQYSYVG